MNYEFEQTEFSRSLLSGVFAGITATVVGIIFNAVFRGMVGYSLSEIINISSIIFIVTILLTIAGLIFYVFHHYLKQGTILFQGAAILVTILLAVGSMHVQRSSDPMLSKEFRELLLGIIGITGLCAIFMIPFLYKKDCL